MDLARLASAFDWVMSWFPRDAFGTHFIPGVIGIVFLLALATWAVLTPNKN